MRKYGEGFDKRWLKNKIVQLEFILRGLSEDSDKYWNIRMEQRDYERMLEGLILGGRGHDRR